MRSAKALSFAAIAFFAPMSAMSSSAMENESMTEHNKHLVEAAFEAWRGQTGSFFDILAPDAKWTIVGTSPMAKTYPTKEALLSEVILPFNARMAVPLKPTVEGLYAEDDMVIALWRGEGVARDGQPYRNTYTWYLQFQGDKVVKAIAFFDMVEFNDFWARVSPAPD